MGVQDWCLMQLAFKKGDGSEEEEQSENMAIAVWAQKPLWVSVAYSVLFI